MSRRLRVCITGGTGLVGKGLEEARPPQCDITSTQLRAHALSSAGVRRVRLDIRDRCAVEEFFRRRRFDVVVHAAGIANVDYAESHFLESWESNVLGTFHVMSACQRRGIHLIALSSNAVFDGIAAPYREADPLRPVNRYGMIKAECERLVRAMPGGWTLVRPILMYGWPHPSGRQNFATWVVKELRRGKRLHIVDDVQENPLHYHQMGRAVWAIAQRRLSGVFHVAGGESVNRYQFAREVANTFGLNPALLQPVSSDFFATIAPRPANTTLVTERMEQELEIQPMSLADGLRALRDQEARSV